MYVHTARHVQKHLRRASGASTLSFVSTAEEFPHPSSSSARIHSESDLFALPRWLGDKPITKAIGTADFRAQVFYIQRPG